MAQNEATGRTLMAMREDVVNAVDSVGRLRTMFNAMAKDHGVPEVIANVEAPSNDEVRDWLRTAFDGAISWRREKSEQFPDDSRNADAVSALTALFRSVDSVPDDLLSKYARLHDKQGAFASGLESDRLRNVGFSAFPTDASEFVTDMIAGLDF